MRWIVRCLTMAGALGMASGLVGSATPQAWAQFYVNGFIGGPNGGIGGGYVSPGAIAPVAPLVPAPPVAVAAPVVLPRPLVVAPYPPVVVGGAIWRPYRYVGPWGPYHHRRW